ncbi:hypothetical protein AK830_g4817 [Neonectria ditissima]|uniref:Uncharacterized protein n=1 Tax=Neonectria ditissima TaxID=78410 RepID=A0A0P7BKC1_9HYPO|nr:hypothetical protein AK830_g4817 [Neonectria ditissima]
MHHIIRLASIAALLSSTSAISVTYSTLYDEGSTPISRLACYKEGASIMPDFGYPEGGDLWPAREEWRFKDEPKTIWHSLGDNQLGSEIASPGHWGQPNNLLRSNNMR